MSSGEGSTSAIQQFCALAQNAKGITVTSLVQQALSHPNVFVFAELLDLPSVQQLADGPDKQTLELLKIFAYGVYSDYKKASSQLPQLTPNQETKLKKLTIVTLSTERKVIPYVDLLQQLDINNVRELEDLVIECIYQGIIKGRLDQKSKQLKVEFAIGRDLKPGDLESIIQTLEAWSSSSDTLLELIKNKIAYAQQYQAATSEKKKEFEERLELAKQNVSETAHAHHGDFSMGDVEYEERRKKGPRKGGARKGKGPVFF